MSHRKIKGNEIRGGKEEDIRVGGEEMCLDLSKPALSYIFTSSEHSEMSRASRNDHGH